jgi:hypothetical protein
MRLFSCAACRQLLFFENVTCGQCGHALAYLPGPMVVSPLELVDPQPEAAGGSVYVALAPEAHGARYRLCANGVQHGICNWAVPELSKDTLCLACGLNEMIPNLADPPAREAWRRLEAAKRRLLYSLIEIGLPLTAPDGSEHNLRFSFKADQGTDKVFTGHHDGLITINIAEADDPFREKTRLQLGETYRTLLGHFRHEVGHYYWDRLIAGSSWLEPYRAEFGDERADYAEAGKRHYKEGAPANWSDNFVSAYASMHPWEDWAEAFAHYLHMVDTLGTARSYGLVLRPTPVGAKPLPEVKTRRVHFDDFDDLTRTWFPLSIALNGLNRSMGLQDVYPFVLSPRAIKKLRFVHEVVEATIAGVETPTVVQQDQAQAEMQPAETS